MKITKEYLRRVIKEELDRAINEMEDTVSSDAIGGRIEAAGLPVGTKEVNLEYFRNQVAPEFVQAVDKLDTSSNGYLVPAGQDMWMLYAGNPPKPTGIKIPTNKIAQNYLRKL